MFGLNAILLLIASAVAFARPVWGFGIIILLTSTLFHLDQYLTIALPVGYLEPTEVLLISMLAAAWLKSRFAVCPSDGIRLIPQDSRSAEIWPIITPYCLWQTLCIGLGLLRREGIDPDFRFGIRFLLSGVFPWIALWILARLSLNEGRKVFAMAYGLTLATACIHLGLQLTDYRSAMNAAYWAVPENPELAWIQEAANQSLARDVFVRALPQGISLILFFTLITTGFFILERKRIHVSLLGAAALLFAALFVTVTRSLIIALTAGMIVLVGLSSLTRKRGVGTFGRVASVLAMFLVGALLYNTIKPGFLDFWYQRVSDLAGADSAIFSEENAARGRDNLAWRGARGSGGRPAGDRDRAPARLAPG